MTIQLFTADHSKRAIAALRAANKAWNPVDEGNGVIRIDFPKVTRETRLRLIEKAKGLKKAYLDGLERFMMETSSDIKETIRFKGFGQKEIKKLEKVVEEYRKVGGCRVCSYS